MFGIRNSDCGTILRFLLYTLAIAFLSAMLPTIVHRGDAYIFSEGGPIEWLQVALLVVTAGVFLIAGTCRKNSGIEILLAIVVLIAVVRETDSILDRLIPVGGWSVPASCLVAAAVVLCWKQKGIVPQGIAFAGTQCFVLLWCGFIMAVPFGQLVGHGTFLRSLMGDDYNRHYKRVIEELCELVGYMFLLMGSLESLIVARNRKSPQSCGGTEG